MTTTPVYQGAVETQENPRLPILLSYAYLRALDDETLRRDIFRPEYEILIDSGGFTALNAGEEIDLGAYMDWLHKWKDSIWQFVALDKLGDPIQSERNLHTMVDNGLRPCPVHVRGDGAARMDELFDVNWFVALGGLRRPRRFHCPKAYLHQKMEWAQGRAVHWLGYVRLPEIVAYTPYACDSASWGYGFRNGLATFYHDQKMVAGKFNFWRGKPLTPRQQRDLEICGIEPHEWSDRTHWPTRKGQRGTPGVLAAYAYVMRTVDILRTTGTRIFLACNPREVSNTLRPAMDRVYRQLNLEIRTDGKEDRKK